MGRKRLLICIDWFYPGFRGGGPLDSCKHLADALATDVDIYILTRITDRGSSEPYENISPETWIQFPRGYKVMYLHDAQLTFYRLRKLINSINPDHIYINSMFSVLFAIYPLVLNRLGLLPRKLKITVAPRGMLLSSALAKKNFKKELFLRGFSALFSKRNVYFHATNGLEQASIDKWFPGKQSLVADNLPNQELPGLINLVKLPGQLRISYIARIDPIKNLKRFLELLVQIGEGQIDLIIGGPVEDRGYWNECEKILAIFPANITVSVLGAVEKREVANVIGSCHLYALLTKGENFGHSIFQAIQAGRPVLISDQTPWRDLDTKGLGFDVSLHDDKEIIRYLRSALAWDQATFDAKVGQCREFAQSYLEKDRNLEIYKSYFS